MLDIAEKIEKNIDIPYCELQESFINENWPYSDTLNPDHEL